jgi:hypothetical protein
MHDGETGCFTLKNLANNGDKPRKQSSEWDCVKVVLFLIQNLLTKAIITLKYPQVSVYTMYMFACIV